MKIRFITALTAAVLLAGCSQSDNSASDITVSATGTSATTTVTTTTAVSPEVTTTTTASADRTTTTEDTTDPDITTVPEETTVISSEGSSGTTSSVSTTSLSSAQTSKPTTTTTTKKVSTTTSKKTTTTSKMTTTKSSGVEEQYHTVTLDPCGGTCSTKTLQVPIDTNAYYYSHSIKICSLPTATRDGYRFMGWDLYPNSDFAYMPTENNPLYMIYAGKKYYTLYATWQKINKGIDEDADGFVMSEDTAERWASHYLPASYYVEIGKTFADLETEYQKACEVYKWMRKNGQGSCIEFSCETYQVCKGAGLECIFVHETSRGVLGHTCNFIKLDGKYYNFDTQSGGEPLGSAGPRCRTFDINDNDVAVPAGKDYASDHGIDGSVITHDFHV